MPRRVTSSWRRVDGFRRTATLRLQNELAAPRFSARAVAHGALPGSGVALYFATGPENFYQFEQWRRPLERLAEQVGVFVVVDRADTGEQVLSSTTLPVAFARGSAALEGLVADRDVRVVLYVNQVEANFRMLRFNAPVHIQVGHGESDKASSISHQHVAYDLTFVGGDAGRDRLGAALRGFDPATRTVPVGRPQLDHRYPGAPAWTGTEKRILYAPTWEGDRPSIAYGSLVSHGIVLMNALLTEPGVRVIYRPHPRTAHTSEAYAAADLRIRALLARFGDRHLVDEGPYGWQWAFADACVTDVSAVAYDWLATGKPLVITEPARSAYRPASPLLDALPLLPVGAAHEVVTLLRGRGLNPAGSGLTPLAALAGHYFGETAEGASSRRFAAATLAAVGR